ncbi:FK506-binding protein 4, partial [Smittium mucronatum]
EIHLVGNYVDYGNDEEDEDEDDSEFDSEDYDFPAGDLDSLLSNGMDDSDSQDDVDYDIEELMSDDEVDEPVYGKIEEITTEVIEPQPTATLTKAQKRKAAKMIAAAAAAQEAVEEAVAEEVAGEIVEGLVENMLAKEEENKEAQTPSKKKKKNKKAKQAEQEKSKDEASHQHHHHDKETVQSKADKKADTKRVLANGLVIEDKKIGTGNPVKNGNKVGMYYIGKLASNNKQFDACTKGKPFHFSLGKGQVIKGWDLGIAGMKIGGERRLTIPPALAYGSRGAPPDIPPNSTLIFDVRLSESR